MTLSLLYLMHYCHQYVNQLAVVQATRSIRQGANSCSSRSRKEKDRALSHARINRDMAETSQSEKRILKSKLEKKIETVRIFGETKLVEGTSRSGKMFRSALITKTLL